MSQPKTIAIDGPAGCGKSAISERIAKRYNYIFVDTGAFYRAITYIVLKSEIPFTDEQKIGQIAQHIKLRFEHAAHSSYRLIANDEDITSHLRSKAVDNHVSSIAQMKKVREALLPLQREVAAQGQIILAGRDIGSVVLPDADLKIYLDASLEERARRRHLQLKDEGEKFSQAEVEASLAKRDKMDSERSTAPLTQAEDAVYIMTDGKSIEEVMQEIDEIITNWT